MKVSDSLSFGMRDALDAECADEVTFVTACKFENIEELEEIISRYLEVYWTKHPQAADATRKAWIEGRILVPKAEGYHAPIGKSGHEIHSSFESWRADVAEHAPNWSMGWCPHTCNVTREQVLACQSISDVYKLFPKEER